MSDELVYEPKSLNEALELSKMLAGGQLLLPEVYRGKPADVLVAMMKGKELGLSTMQALFGIFVIKGKVGMYADTAVGLVKSKPVCLRFEMVESTAERAVYVTQRKGEKPRDYGYTMAMAQKAGFTSGNANYAKNPEAMLRARCSMTLARIVYPDVLAGIYSPEELQDDDGSGGGSPLPALIPLSEQMAATAPKQSRTETLKGQLRTKQLAAKTASLEIEAPQAKPSGLVIEVKPGQTEAEAEAAHKAAKHAKTPPQEFPHYDAILELGKAYGKTAKQMASIIKGATGKERPSQLDHDDVARVHDSLVLIKKDEDEHAAGASPYYDGDVPFGE